MTRRDMQMKQLGSADHMYVSRRPPSPSETSTAEYVESSEDVKAKIWGPYHFVASTTLQIFTCPEDASGWRKFLCFAPNLIVLLLLISRVVFMMIHMSSAISLSLYWAYSGSLFFLSLHGMIGALALFIYKTSNYFEVTVDMLRKAARDNLTGIGRRECIFQSIVYAFLMIPSVYIIVENYTMYDHDVTDVVRLNQTFHNISSNLTAGFRKSMLGNRNLLFFDGLLIVLGSYCAANALVVYLLANQALCREYARFNQRLKEHIDDGSILELAVIKRYESQLIEYLSTARFITNTASFLLDVTFIAGLFIQISAQFALKSFAQDISSVQNALFGLWTGQSVYFLVLSTMRPAALQALLMETTSMLWLDQGIWSRNEDPLIREIARSITQRIDSIEYASKSLSPVRWSNVVFNMIMFVIPFFVDLLGGAKFQPWFRGG